MLQAKKTDLDGVSGSSDNSDDHNKNLDVGNLGYGGRRVGLL